jgi:hypothetical protein
MPILGIVGHPCLTHARSRKSGAKRRMHAGANRQKARKDELGLSNTLCDELLNRPPGFVDHYIGTADKGIGPVAFTLLCELFAIEFVARPNLAAAKRMEEQWEQRTETQVRVRPIKIPKAILDWARPIVLSEMAKKGWRTRQQRAQSAAVAEQAA